MMDSETLIRQDEGRRLYLYDDATGKRIVPGYTLVGNPTIGTGCNVSTIDEDEDAWLFHHRYTIAWRAVVRLLKGYPRDEHPMSEPRLAALENMAYNLGERGLLKFAGMLKAIHAGDWGRAAAEVLWTDPDAETLQPTPYARRLTNRAHRNAEMLRTGEWPAGNS